MATREMKKSAMRMPYSGRALRGEEESGYQVRHSSEDVFHQQVMMNGIVSGGNQRCQKRFRFESTLKES